MKEKVTRKSYYCTTFLNYIRPLLNGNLWALACPNWPRWRRLTSPATASVLSSQSSQIKTNKNKKKFRVIKPLLLPAWVLFPHDLIIIIKTHPSSIRSLYKQAEERPLSVPIYTPHSILHMHFIWPLSFPPTVTCTLHTAHIYNWNTLPRESLREREIKLRWGWACLDGWGDSLRRPSLLDANPMTAAAKTRRTSFASTAAPPSVPTVPLSTPITPSSK